MKNLIQSIIAVLLLGVSNLAFSQAAGNYLYNNPHAMNADRATIAVNHANSNNVNLKAEVLMNVKATSYTAIFAMTQNGRDSYEADSLLKKQILC